MIAHSSQFEGQRAVVTGGTRGIGAATVRLLAESGARVVAAARTVPDQSRAGVSFVSADMSTADGVAALAAAALETLGGVDIVVNNAGSQTRREGGALDFDDADYQTDFDTNFLSAVRLDRALAPRMIDQGGGVIVHIGSGAARVARPQSLAYTAAKAALTAYSKGLATDLAPHSVRVNVVHPGLIYTERLESRITDIAKASARPAETVLDGMVRELGVPAGRAGTADEVAAVIAFLASPAASYLTGSQIQVDGGVMPTV